MKNSFLTVVLCAISVNTYAQLMITGVVDGPLPGGLPKGVELYVSQDITDLSVYGIGSANNGGGSDGEEFSFPSVAATAGEYIYIAREAVEFENFFGFAPDYTTAVMSINGDDAIELFENGAVVDLYGDINVDGSGQTWDYLDGWAYRNGNSERSATFTPSDWLYSGTNALDGETDNNTAAIPVPLSSFTGTSNGGGNPNATARLISEIQGTPATQQSNSFGDNDVSPLLGEQVIIEGVVVGDFQNGDADDSRNLNGFYVQEQSSDEDGDPASSEAVFVLDQSFGVNVKLGDLVSVTGTVDQYYGETQIDTVTAVQVLATDSLSLVTPATISLLSVSDVTINQDGDYQPDLEAYEGMLVTVTDSLQITEQHQLDRFNEIKLVAGERAYQFTQQNTPSAVLLDQHQQALGVRRITYDDGLNVQNASINNLDGFATYNETSAKRMGDTITNMTGILDYKWSGNASSSATWRIRSHVDGSNVFTSTQDGNSPNPRPQTPSAITGTLKVASFNVLNFFTTLDDASTTTAAGHSPRGADDLTRFGVTPATAEFNRQQAKLINALQALNADIVGLIELENEFDANNDGSTAIETLVNALNTQLGSTVYDYVYPGSQFVGSDAIAVGFIYKPAVVNITNASTVATLDDSVAATLNIFSGRDFSTDPIFDGASTNRVPVAVSFTHLQSQDVLTVVANHFKSKGTSGLTDTNSPNYDQTDGAGYWNQRRLDAAMAVDAWLQTAPTGVSDEDVIVLGDLNAYAQEDPVQYLLNNGYNSVETGDAYSYVFDGQIGTLDYILVSNSLAAKITTASVWHINADEADAIDYNLDYGRDSSYFDSSTAARNSDHDPLLVGFNLVSTSTTAAEILAAFKAAVAAGDIQSRSWFFPRFKRYLFQSLLHRAVKHEKASCRYLSFAQKFSDGKHHPRDLIKGPAKQELHSLIVKALQDKGCRTR